jgi:hypothetical protein
MKTLFWIWLFGFPFVALYYIVRFVVLGIVLLLTHKRTVRTPSVKAVTVSTQMPTEEVYAQRRNAAVAAGLSCYTAQRRHVTTNELMFDKK